jgi:thiamine kinase-like enzyme
LDPDSALRDWQSWSCALRSRPVIVREFANGRTNRSFLLDAAGQHLVMRLNAQDAALPGIDRANELPIWIAAHKAGVAPAVLHADEDAGILVTEYLDGPTLKSSDLDGSLTDHLVRTLQAVHKIGIDTRLISFATHIDMFWRDIEKRQSLVDESLLQQREPLRMLVREFVKAAGPVGLCHHDPVPENFVRRHDRLYLLDWEYAARGPVVMDYAALSVEWDIDNTEIAQRTGVDPELLESAQQIYRYICALWAEIRN